MANNGPLGSPDVYFPDYLTRPRPQFERARPNPPDWTLEVQHPNGNVERLTVPGTHDIVSFSYSPGVSAPWFRRDPAEVVPMARTVTARIPRRRGEWVTTPEGFAVRTVDGPVDPDPPLGFVTRTDPLTGQQQLAGVAPHAPPAEPQLTTKRLIELLRENVEVRTKLELVGTDLTVRVRMVMRDGDKEVVISDDEDSVDLAELKDAFFD